MCLFNNLGQSQLFSYFCHPVRFDQASGFTCIQKSSIFVQICHFSSQNANCCDTTFDNVTAIPSLATAAPSLTTGLVTVKPSLAMATTKSGYAAIPSLATAMPSLATVIPHLATVIPSLATPIDSDQVWQIGTRLITLA